MDIEKLIHECKNNVPQSQRTLFYHFYNDMARIVMRYCADLDDAKEVLNDGFYSVFSNIKTFKGDSQFKTWMTTIFIRESIKKINRNKRIPSVGSISLENELENLASDDDNVLDRIETKEMMALIDQLPRIEKVVFNLHFFEGYKHKEIAELCGFSEGTSRWYLNGAKNHIKNMYTDHNHLTNKENEIAK